MMRSFLQFLRYLLKRDLVIFGRYNDVLAYPLLIASYIVPVRQYRILQSGFLHCIPRGKPACHLLMLLGTTPAHKGLAPFGTNTVHNLFGIPKINLHFSNLFRTSSCVHCHPCRAHTMLYINMGYSWHLKVKALRNTAKLLIWLLDIEIKNKIKNLATCSLKSVSVERRTLHSRALVCHEALVFQQV
jgi:hypothetical protein